MRFTAVAPRYLLAGAVIACGCAGDAKVRVEPPAQPALAVAVAPLAVRFVADPFESARRTEDVLAALWRGSTWTVLSPREYRVLHAGRPPLLGTDLVVQAHALGLDPHRLALLRTGATLREARGQALVSGGGKVAVGRDYAGEIEVSLELVAMDGRPMAEVTMTRPIDPFAERPEYDELPVLREAITAAVQALVDQCRACVAPSWRPPLDLQPSPAVVLAGVDAGGHTLGEVIRTAAGLDGDLLLLKWLQYLEPQITVSRARQLAATPFAACLRGAGPQGLEAGDCVVTAAGEPVDGPHALARLLARARAAGETVELVVLDAGGRRREVRLGASAL